MVSRIPWAIPLFADAIRACLVTVLPDHQSNTSFMRLYRKKKLFKHHRAAGMWPVTDSFSMNRTFTEAIKFYLSGGGSNMNNP